MTTWMRWKITCLSETHVLAMAIRLALDQVILVRLMGLRCRGWPPTGFSKRLAVGRAEALKLLWRDARACIERVLDKEFIKYRKPINRERVERGGRSRSVRKHAHTRTNERFSP